ncbi:MAG: hypothetical protein ABII00_12775 [Elusimicrobiota bacterium]
MSPRQALLTEMRGRRIVPPDAADWTPDEYTLLLRLREAQSMGAFRLLRSKLGTLRGYAAQVEVGAGLKEPMLTKRGYRTFLFLLAQQARGYFEGKGAEARFVFELQSLGGKPLFDGEGGLTQEGVEIYNRVRRELPAFWRYPDGTVTGSVRPPRRLRKGGEEPPAGAGEAPRPSAEDARALGKITALMRSGYVEISESEKGMLLEAAKMDDEQLERETSLVVIRTESKVFYLISPSDPLMDIVARHRSGEGEPPPPDKAP